MNLIAKSKSLFAALLLGIVTAVVALPAAAAVDVTEVVTEIEGAAAPIALIGAAVLVIMVGIKVWKWVRRAM